MAKKKKAVEGKQYVHTGRMQYLGPDDWESGLQHGRYYEVKVEEMKSGRYSVEIVPDDYSVRIKRHKYHDKIDYKMYWRTQ